MFNSGHELTRRLIKEETIQDITAWSQLAIDVALLLATSGAYGAVKAQLTGAKAALKVGSKALGKFLAKKGGSKLAKKAKEKAIKKCNKKKYEVVC